MSSRRQSVVRNLLIGTLVLLLLYAAAGFLLLPWWLKQALPEQLQQRFGWQAELASVSTNPFTLTLELEGLGAADAEGEKVLSLDSLFVNLGLWSLPGGTIDVEEMLLQKPFLRLDLLADGSLNLVRDWKQHQAPDPETTAAAAFPRVLLEQLTIDGGELLFRDRRQSAVKDFHIRPVDLSLQNFASWSRQEDDGRYSLLAALGDQTLEWEGSLSLDPLYSRGRIQLNELEYDTLAHFLADALPWQLRGGSLSLSTDYVLQAGERLQLVTDNGEVNVSGLALGLPGDDGPAALSVSGLSLQGVAWDLGGHSLQLGQLRLTQPEIRLRRQADGQIDWMAALPEADNPAADTDAGAADTPLRWSLDGVQVDAGQVYWQDLLPEGGAELQLQTLALTLGAVNQQLDEPVPYRVQASLGSGGELAFQGQFTPQPFTLETSVAGTGISLNAFAPYLRQQANLALADGVLSLDGDLDLDAQTQPLTGTFNGSAEIRTLTLAVAEPEQPLLSLQRLQLASIEYNVHPARLEIGSVTLDAPEVTLLRDTDGELSIARVLPAASAAAEDAATPESGDGSPLIFRIGGLLLENGAIAYTDRTLEPAFTTTVDSLNGSLSGLSNIPPQQGQLMLTGRVGQVGELAFRGTLGAVGGSDRTDLDLRLSGLSLPALSPYFGRYLGYSVDSGKLDLEMEYALTDTRIDASNRIRMDQLELGQAVASEEAVKAPVKLGLALLTDRDGVIEVDLPVSGDLSDPGFRVGQVVARAFVNLLVKAAASPFTMLGSIVEMTGLTGADLGQVRFVPGRVELAESEAVKLAALAQALQDRPELLLNVRGAVSPQADGLALLRQQRTAPGDTWTEEAWAAARDAYLADGSGLPPEALNNLARDRGLAVRQLLTQTHGAPAEQVFLLDPSRQAETGPEGNVIVPFALDVR